MQQNYIYTLSKVLVLGFICLPERGGQSADPFFSFIKLELFPVIKLTMSLDSPPDCTPIVNFYIGANEHDDDEEGFGNDCEPFSASYVSLLTQIWNDISTWEDGYNPPLDLAIKILRILQGLRISPYKRIQTLASYNAFLNRRIAKVSAALQEYKDHLCTQVFSVLEEKEEHDVSEIKDEIQQIKMEIEHAKLLSYQKNQHVRKNGSKSSK
ncbi:uncharacterized protein LOC142741062 [Rhinoderma darwinii]|uniref:uncharacterized protein LOC142741062 n=1 Tax=Rhinoderma darwinii TaxID=43563 RepID=UPI003F66AD80